MTRDELIEIISNDTSCFSCPDYHCDMPEEEGNTGECCRRCAEKQLAEYEEYIRADERKRFAKQLAKWLNERCGTEIPSVLK